jgi:hypothetical protein
MNPVVESLMKQRRFEVAKPVECVPYITADWSVNHMEAHSGTRYRWEARMFWEQTVYKDDPGVMDYVVTRAHREMSDHVYGKYAKGIRSILHEIVRDYPDVAEKLYAIVDEMEGR